LACRILTVKGISTAKFVWFCRSSTKLRMHVNYVTIALPVNILMVWRTGFLATQQTTVCLAIYFDVITLRSMIAYSTMIGISQEFSGEGVVTLYCMAGQNWKFHGMISWKKHFHTVDNSVSDPFIRVLTTLLKHINLFQSQMNTWHIAKPPNEITWCNPTVQYKYYNFSNSIDYCCINSVII